MPGSDNQLLTSPQPDLPGLVDFLGVLGQQPPVSQREDTVQSTSCEQFIDIPPNLFHGGYCTQPQVAAKPREMQASDEARDHASNSLCMKGVLLLIDSWKILFKDRANKRKF